MSRKRRRERPHGRDWHEEQLRRSDCHVQADYAAHVMPQLDRLPVEVRKAIYERGMIALQDFYES